MPLSTVHIHHSDAGSSEAGQVPPSSATSKTAILASPSRAIPGLDGLRGLSIFLVVVTHARDTTGFPSHIPLYLTGLAGLGVQIFFVISGFLISRLLLVERSERGGIDVVAFYVRRSLRILPAFVTFVVIMLLLRRMGELRFSNSHFLAAITYTMNFVPDPSWTLGHIWSLSVEEQFYILWPAVLAYLSRIAGIRGAASVFLLSPVVMGTLHILHSPYATYCSGRWFPFVADSIAVGCLLAFVPPGVLGSRYGRAALQSKAAWLLVPALYCIYSFRNHPRLYYPFGEWVVLLTIAYFVARASTYPIPLLQFKPLMGLGTLSYSLYLWQQPFLVPHGTRWFTWFPQNLLLAFAAAVLSHFVVERPALSYRKHFRRHGLGVPSGSRVCQETAPT